MDNKLDLIAACAFGLEATVKREITALGYKITSASDGRIDFSGGLSAVINANISLGAADRVLIKIGEFEAHSFDQLFEQTKALDWHNLITKDGEFTVTGKSVKSKLHSVPDCQAIVKKAVVESLKRVYHIERFSETGPAYKIQVALLRDKATLTIDTTGPSLHRRGYRNMRLNAPIKETLAYALIELSYWRKDRIFYDPFCGSGTLAIEAARMARNIPPGLHRSFVCEKWPQIPKQLWARIREDKQADTDANFKPEIYASDIDATALETARLCANAARVADCVKFSQADIKNAVLPGGYGVMITNPPYGERLVSQDEADELYRALGRLMKGNDTWSSYILTSSESFEKPYGKKADAKRKLFNGNVKTDYYQFYGKKPGR